MTEKVDHPIIRSSTPCHVFNNFGRVTALKVFPDGHRMAANSSDGMLRVWDFKKGVLLKELELRGEGMQDLAISQDGKLIVASDQGEYLTAWDGDTGRRLTQAYLSEVYSFDISPDGKTLAVGSLSTVTLRNIATWQLQGEPIRVKCRELGDERSVLYSPSGQFLAIGTTSDIQIWDPATRKLIATLNQPNPAVPLWTPDSTRLLAVAVHSDSIQQWDSSTWKPIGSSIWTSDRGSFAAINCNGTVVAFPTTYNRVRLWHLSDCRTVALFQHSGYPRSVAFSVDGKQIFAGGEDQKISVWAVPENAWPEGIPNDQATHQAEDCCTGTQGCVSRLTPSQNPNPGVQDCGPVSKILAMSAAVRSACVRGNLATAEELLTQEIDANGENYHSYANRSIVLARKLDWDGALKDATKSLSIQHSLIGYISEGIALCGRGQVRDAERVFDLSFTFANGDSVTIYFIFIIKAIALFNANQHAEAMRRVRNLAFSGPDIGTTAGCRAIEAYLLIQLGNNALAHNCPCEAAGYFTAAAISTNTLINLAIDTKYEDFVVLFGCDLNFLWQTACQKRCHALLRAGKLDQLFEAYRYMVEACHDEAMKASCLSWSIGFMEELSTFLGHPLTADSAPDMGRDDYENNTISDSDSDIDISSSEPHSASDNIGGVPHQGPEIEMLETPYYLLRN